MEGENAISFTKVEIGSFMDPNPEFRWFELTPDLSVGKVKEDHKAGMVSVKLSIHDKTKNGPIDFNMFDAWSKPVPKRPKNFKVRAFIF